MKKNRLTSFLLLAGLLAGLVFPLSAGATETQPVQTPAPSAAPSSVPQQQSALLASMHIEGTAALLVDDDTGEVLYEQNAHGKVYPASITKVMTCLLTLESIARGEHQLDEVVTVGDQVNYGIGADGSTAGIKAGEQLTIHDLLGAALIPSANEACNAMAQLVVGDVEKFVDLMNQRAQELGMNDTHFANPHGYHDPDHYTSAYDIYLVAHEAMKDPTFRELVSSVDYKIPATNFSEARTLHSTNGLVSTWRVRDYWYEYATGIKTGSTPEAGHCLVSSATKNDRNLIAVVMGAANYTENKDVNYFTESKRLLEFGFNNFSRQTILDGSSLDFPEVSVTLSKTDYVTVRPAGSLSATLPNDIDPAAFQRELDLPESVEAPVEEGQVLGTVTLTYNGQEYGKVDLVANSSVERSELLYRLDRIQKFFDQLWVRIVLVVLAVLLVFLFLRHLITGRKRSRYGGSRARGGRGSSRYSGRRRR